MAENPLFSIRPEDQNVNIYDEDTYALIAEHHTNPLDLFCETGLLEDILEELHTDLAPKMYPFCQDVSMEMGYLALSVDDGQEMSGTFFRYFSDDEVPDKELGQKDGTIPVLLGACPWGDDEELVKAESLYQVGERIIVHPVPLDVNRKNVLNFARYLYGGAFSKLELILAQQYLSRLMRLFGKHEEDGRITYRYVLTPQVVPFSDGTFRVSIEATLWVWGKQGEEGESWYRFKDFCTMSHTSDAPHIVRFDSVECAAVFPSESFPKSESRQELLKALFNNPKSQARQLAAELERRYGLPEGSVLPAKRQGGDWFSAYLTEMLEAE